MNSSIRQGIETLSLRAELKRAALSNIARWSSEPRFLPYRPYIEHLAARGDHATLADSFYRTIPFGTGGRRGPVGVGPNRINPHTLSTSVQGHVLYLRERYKAAADLAVVVAADVRVFHDLRGLFTGLVGPLTRLSSRELAVLAARVYAANGIRAWLLPPEDDSYLSTPELSFLIRHLGAVGGLNVSASHNHPDDNGGKLYNALGGQEIPPDDEAMAAIVEQVEEALLIDEAEGLRRGLILPIGPEQRRRYQELNLSLLPRPASTSARIVFTPLHGTGSTTVLPVLRKAGFSVEVEPSQSSFDGAFPAVPFRIPNPEVARSMDRARGLAQQLGADLVLATDPDADRLGVLAPDGEGRWHPLSGNETAALLLAHLLARRGRGAWRGAGPPSAAGGKGPAEDSPYIITTWVTTSILERMARAGGVACVGTLPVGFKYIAHVLRCLEEEGSYTEQGWGRTLHAELEGFLLAAEESYGFLVTPELRDKDATGAALLLAELASLQRDRGETLLDLLDRIHLEHGVVVNTLVSLVMQGANGLERIESIQASLRAEPPSRIAGCPVTAIVDWHDEQRFGPFRSSTDERARNVLCFFLADGTKVTLRPSGTEPKNKTYVEVAGEPLPAGTSLALLEAERSRLRSWAREVADDSVCQAMLRVGITVPEAALRISDLVPLEERLRVVQVVAPRLLKEAYRLEQGETTLDEVRGWLERELRPCGNDPRELVAEGIFAALDRQTIPLRVRELVHNVLEG